MSEQDKELKDKELENEKTEGAEEAKPEEVKSEVKSKESKSEGNAKDDQANVAAKESGHVSGGFQSEEVPETFEKVLHINRCAKVVKGGRRFHFSALIVSGNGNGELGYGLGKANDVASAIRKGVLSAKKDKIKIQLKGTSIPHEVLGHYGAGKVLLKPAKPGTGIIASGAVRATCEACGIKDIFTKCLGTKNPINVLKATVDGLSQLRTMRKITEEGESSGKAGKE